MCYSILYLNFHKLSSMELTENTATYKILNKYPYLSLHGSTLCSVQIDINTFGFFF